jgi:hypothetical protein
VPLPSSSGTWQTPFTHTHLDCVPLAAAAGSADANTPINATAIPTTAVPTTRPRGYRAALPSVMRNP